MIDLGSGKFGIDFRSARWIVYQCLGWIFLISVHIECATLAISNVLVTVFEKYGEADLLKTSLVTSISDDDDKEEWSWVSAGVSRGFLQLHLFIDLGPVSISDKTSYFKILGSLEAMRFVFRIGWSLWNLTGLAALLPMCLSNFKAMR